MVATYYVSHMVLCMYVTAHVLMNSQIAHVHVQLLDDLHTLSILTNSN